MNPTTLGAFDSYEATYESDGSFDKTILIPRKIWQNNDQTIVLFPEQVVAHIDISSDETAAMLEVLEHGHNHYDDLSDEELMDVQQSGQLTVLIENGFDPAEERDVRIISIHNEDYRDWSPEEQQDFAASFKTYIEECAYDNTGDCNISVWGYQKGIIRPNAAGNVILRPR